MQFEDIITCLENPEKRNEYIARLKSAGQNSQPVLDLKNSMEGVNMNKPPKNIFETTMLQHTFKYCDPLECFFKFRLVCKPWQNAVETIKFDQFNAYALLKHYADHPIFVQKYLQIFKKLYIPGNIFRLDTIDWAALGEVILKSMKKLNEVDIRRLDQNFTSEQQSCIQEILKNSANTLKKVYVSEFIFPNVSFPRLTTIKLDINTQISKQKFLTNFPTLLQNMEHLELVSFFISLLDRSMILYKYIEKNYQQHCISSFIHIGLMLNHLPLKIAMYLQDLNNLENKKYNNEVEYLHIIQCFQEDYDPEDLGWNRYQEIFDQCSKLKQIAFDFEDDSEEMIELDNLPPIWNDRMEYFKKRGIQIVDPVDIVNNEDLQEKVAKEVGIKWRFHFH